MYYLSRILIFVVASITWVSPILGQNTNSPEVDFIPYVFSDNQLAQGLDRYEIKSDSIIMVHTALHDWTPYDLDELIIDKEWKRQNNIYTDTIGKNGFLNHFYQSPKRLYEVKGDHFQLGINPILHFKVGRDLSNDNNIFLNKRGIELYGRLDNRFSFYSAYEENQSNFLGYQDDFVSQFKAIRGKGNYKDYSSSIISGLVGYDYGFATGFLQYKLSQHTSIQLGHNRYFIGNGIRSLLLSDSGHNYFNVKFSAKFWKLHYQTIFAELSTISARFNFGNQLLPKKYMANHYLSFKPTRNLELGIYEVIIFSRENNFELQYLNPVIFYRTLEHQLDSPDNVLIGTNFKLNLLNSISIYGQFILDEFRTDQLFSSEKWWGNKFGLQLGMKYLDVLSISKLDLQLEYNRVRPYTYSHWQPSQNVVDVTVSNYSHYNQPLAHPLGANFTELLVELRYDLPGNWQTRIRGMFTETGLNNEANNGGNILISNTTRIADFGIEQNQGKLSRIRMLHLNLYYQISNNLFWDIESVYRVNQIETLPEQQTLYLGTALRYNIGNQFLDY